jgi:hypothetical protein
MSNKQTDECTNQLVMTLRDWFAGQALCGYIAANPSIDDHKAAEWSYATADAMLAAREKAEAGI